MAFHGVDLNARVMELQNQFRNQIRNRGGQGIRSFGRIFRQLDNNGNKKLDIAEFTEALAVFGLFPKKTDVQGLFKAYDIDGDGNIGYEEFLRGMREELSERKKAMVQRAFDMLDKDGSGVITPKDVMTLYDVRQNPEFIDGTKTKKEIVEDFLDSFDGLKGNDDGKITKKEFFDYYTDLAISTPTEEYFVVMMQQTWGIGEDESSEDFQTQLRYIVGLFRQRLITLSNGQQEEYKLQQLFDEFDANANGMLTMDELAAMLAKLEISVERKYLSALIAALDKDKSGAIEFAEFKDFIIYDPYK